MEHLWPLVALIILVGMGKAISSDGSNFGTVLLTGILMFVLIWLCTISFEATLFATIAGAIAWALLLKPCFVIFDDYAWLGDLVAAIAIFYLVFQYFR